MQQDSIIHELNDKITYLEKWEKPLYENHLKYIDDDIDKFRVQPPTPDGFESAAQKDFLKEFILFLGDKHISDYENYIELFNKMGTVYDNCQWPSIKERLKILDKEVYGEKPPEKNH